MPLKTKKTFLLTGFFILALTACGSNYTGYTDVDYCRWQQFSSYETCMSAVQDCRDINPNDEATIGCMASQGYPVPEEGEVPGSGN